MSLVVTPQGRSWLRPAAGDPLAPLPDGTIGFTMTALGLWPPAGESAGLSVWWAKPPGHGPGRPSAQTPGRVHTSVLCSGGTGCPCCWPCHQPKAEREACGRWQPWLCADADPRDAVPAWAGLDAAARPGRPPAVRCRCAVGVASVPCWSPVTAAVGVTAREQLAAVCGSAAASDRTRGEEDSGSSQSGAWDGPTPPPDPADSGPQPGSGREDRRPALHWESGPGSPASRAPN